MNNVEILWGKRRSEYWTMAVRYLRLIGNSGFLFTIYLLFVFGSYYYGQLIQWLPETFPAVLFFTVVITWICTRGRIRTFITKGDVYFLTPLEGKLGPYFRLSFRYSWMMETFWVALLMLLLAPLYFDRIDQSGTNLLLTLLFLSGLKAWNLLAGFEEQRILDKYHYMAHTLLRVGLTAVTLYAIFTFQPIWLIGFLALALIVFYVGYFRKISHLYSLKWERLIEIENQTVMTFYRIANSFTDVPKLSSKVRYRRWLNPVYKMISFQRKNVFHYLFARSFIRANDYFGIYVRLTFLGALFLSIVELDWGRWLIAGLFAYMTALQIETLKHHYDTSQMIELYPIVEKSKYAGHRYWLLILGSVQSVIFASIVLLSYGAVAGIVVLMIAFIIYQYHGQIRLPKKYETSS